MHNSAWCLSENSIPKANLAHHESLFTLANGYLGFRGFFSERTPAYHPAVFINGFFEKEQISYGEKAYGFPEFGQAMVDVPDVRYARIYIQNQLFSFDTCNVTDYSRVLDMRKGELTTKAVWTTADGITAVISWVQCVSYSDLHTAVMNIHITTSKPCSLAVQYGIAQPQSREYDPGDPRVGVVKHDVISYVSGDSEASGNEGLSTYTFSTANSNLNLMCGSYIETATPGAEVIANKKTPALGSTLDCKIESAAELESSCYCIYHHGKRDQNSVLEEAFQESITLAKRLKASGFFHAQERIMEHFWNSADIIIEGDPEIQKSIRFALFQLYQSTGKDGKTSLAAKGLTGAGYDGHYFWDTEIYAMPFFTCTAPAIARSLLLYRYGILDKARRRAEELSLKGALYPWRTIDGEEASAYFPAGTAQYHINADIAYSILQYWYISGDFEFICSYGAEMLFETARLWADLGFFNERRRGKFCIHEVTGPDEYSALVNNNYYTNRMAQFHLLEASKLAVTLQKEHPEVWNRVSGILKLDPAEPLLWKEAAEAMFLPFDPETGLHPQDDGFLDLEVWDFEKRPKEKYPLLLYYHPLVIYRYQVLKQADVVLAHTLLGNDIPMYQKRRDFLYYERLTTGDSSLSACTQALAALEVGFPELGMEHFLKTLYMDIHDLHGNSRDGLHTAAMAGSWLDIVFGFGGFRWTLNGPSFSPRLPKQWDRLTWRMYFQEKLIEISHTQYESVYTCLTGGELNILHNGHSYTITAKPLIISHKKILKGVVFDLDGVITNTDTLHYKAWKRVADEHGWFFSPELNESLRGVSRTDSLKIILKENGLDPETIDLFQLTETKNRYYKDSLAALTAEQVLPGVNELLAALRSQQIKTALASASKNAPYILSQLGLDSAFDCIVDAATIEVGKPDPEIFYRAAEGLGLQPEECLGVEDAKAGIEAIIASGMGAVAIGPAACGHGELAAVSGCQELSVEFLRECFG